MRFSRFLQIIITCLTLVSGAAWADVVEYVVSGVDEPMLSNVRDHVTAFQIGSGARLNTRLRRNLTEKAINASLAGMRPYGYFNPVVDVEFTRVEKGSWLLVVNLEPGPPVIVKDLQLELTGPGKELKSLNDWYANFPLAKEQVLNQPVWDKAKLDAMDLLEEAGYLQAEFSRHEIRVDPVANTARL